MKCILRIGIIAAIAAVACSCRQHDYRTTVISIPEMKNQACAVIISNAIVQYSRGPNMDNSIDPAKLQFDLKGRSLAVEYDSMKLAIKNLEHVISDLGFDANQIPANSNAATRLPPECR